MENISQKSQSWLSILGKTVLFLACCYFSFSLLMQDHPWIFIDNLNLFIHEAGHPIFSIFGEFMMFLGGTLMQTLVPILFLVYFLFKRDLFASAFVLFWLGDNFVNESIYIKDANTMELPLFGGGTHDWNWILSRLNMLDKDQLIGNIVYTFGALALVLSVVLLLFILIIDISTKLKVKTKNIPFE
jgi:hypothetical protein